MQALEFDIFQPVQHHPEHIVVGLVADTECILTKIKSGCVTEEMVDRVLQRDERRFPLLCRIVDVGRSGCQGRQRRSNMRSQNGSGPVDAGGPSAHPEHKVFVLHDMERIEKVSQRFGRSFRSALVRRMVLSAISLFRKLGRCETAPMALLSRSGLLDGFLERMRQRMNRGGEGKEE